MKLTGSLFFVVIMLAVNACGSSEAEKQAELIKKTMRDNTPGTIATSGDGYYLKAKVDGKEWKATHMMPDESTNSTYYRVFGENDGESIGFTLSARNLQAGTIREFGEDNAADLMLNEEEGGIYGGRKGEIQILKSDGKWVEGSFHFSANSSMSKTTHEVTEGTFRVPFPAMNSSAAY